MSALNDLLPYRVTQVELKTEKLDKEKADNHALTELTAEVRGLRRTLSAFVVAVSTSSIVFAFTVLGAHVH